MKIAWNDLTFLPSDEFLELLETEQADEHFSVTGDIHRQLHNLPDGTKVRMSTKP